MYTGPDRCAKVAAVDGTGVDKKQSRKVFRKQRYGDFRTGQEYPVAAYGVFTFWIVDIGLQTPCAYAAIIETSDTALSASIKFFKRRSIAYGSSGPKPCS